MLPPFGRKVIYMAEIKKIYVQNVPQMRFIGVKYTDSDRVNGSFGAKWGKAWETGLFEKIEKNISDKSFYEDSDAYIGFMKGGENVPFEYWIGMFTPVNTDVPEGLSYIDFEESRLGVGLVYGSDEKGEIYGKEAEVLDMLHKNGYKEKETDGAVMCFERYQCPRYTTPDENGNVILDICFFIE